MIKVSNHAATVVANGSMILADKSCQDAGVTEEAAVRLHQTAGEELPSHDAGEQKKTGFDPSEVLRVLCEHEHDQEGRGDRLHTTTSAEVALV